MAFVLADRVKETTIVVGTGAATLLGAQAGYQSFSAGVGASNTTYYTIADQSGSNWEVGYGTLDATGLILTRTTVLSSSNSGSAVSFTTGTKDVWCDYTAKKAVIQDSLGLVTVPVLQTSSTSSVTPVLTFNGATTNYAAGAAVSGSYLQTILQNSSATAGASTNYVLSNNLGTDSTYYGEFGMNSSVFSSSTPSDFYSINNGIYFSGHDGDVSVGSGNGYKTYLTYGTAGQSSHVINASGAIGLSTNLGTTPALSGTTGYGTSGQVLTSGGSSAAPTWTTPTTGTVTSVTGTAPVVSSGGTTPAISMAAATTSVNGYLTSTDWSTFNGKQAALVSGTNIKTVAGVSLLGSGDVGLIGGTYGGTGVNNGANTITVGGNVNYSGAYTQTWTRSANTSLTLPVSGTVLSSVTAPATNPISGTPSSSNYLRGDGTWSAVSVSAAGSNTQIQYNNSGAFGASSAFTFDGTTNTSPVQAASNGFFVNPNTNTSSYTIPSGSNAVTAGKFTVATSTTITVSTGSRWVVV